VTADLDALRSAFAELTALHGWARLQTPRSLLLALTGRVGAVASLVQWQPEARLDVVDDAVTRIRGAVEASTP